MIHKGARGPHYKGPRIEWTRQAGRRVIERWEGTSSEIAGLEAGIASTYDGYFIERIGNTPAWFIEAFKNNTSTGQQPAITETFELDINVIQESNRFSPVLLTKLSEDQIIIVLGVYNRVKLGKSDYTHEDGIETINTQISGSNNGNALDFYDDLIRGINHFLDFNPVFRWTRSAGRSVSLPINTTNSKKVYTSSAALLTGEGITGLPFTLPAKEWLKLWPRARAQYEGQSEVLYEYYAADVWTRNYYELAS